MPTLRERARALAQKRWFPALAAAVLLSPSLTNGLDLDDLIQRFKARGAFGGTLFERIDLFTFWPTEPGAQHRFFDLGYTPWFIPPEYKVAFFRPLAGL